jgi:hypothetical protein
MAASTWRGRAELFRLNAGLDHRLLSLSFWKDWLERLFGLAETVGQPQAKRQERRQYQRLTCPLIVSYKSAMALEGDALTGRCQDLSLGGMAMVVPAPWAVGTLLQVELNASAPHIGPTRLFLVRHVSTVAAERWLIGGSFYTELSDDELDALCA